MSKVLSNELLLLKTYLETKNNLNQNQNGELEVKFGTRGIKAITKITFDNVIQQLLANNFQFKEESKYYLSIKSNNIRSEIIGVRNIQEYCRTNTLPTEYPKEGYNFTEKKAYTSEGERSNSIINFDEFNFRISYSIETELSPESTAVQEMIKTWQDNKRFYRLINRYTMIHAEFPVVIDLSIVRESNKEVTQKDGYTIKQSNIFNSTEKYEIEIEIDNQRLDKVLQTIEDKLNIPSFLDKILKRVTKFILSGLQGTNYPITYTEQTEIINNYLQLFKKSDYHKVKIAQPKDFIGPSSSTLQIINIAQQNLDTNIVNIRNNYTVTDKADGDRKLLYISANGKIYLITTIMNIQFTGAETKNHELFNSLLDGEHIKHNKTGQFINLYAAFDIYFINSKDIRSLEFAPTISEFVKTKFRLPLLSNFIKSLDAVLVNTKKFAPIRIEKKRFYYTSETQSIFDGCNTIQEEINQGLYEYITDGLIFTPSNLGVGFNKSDDFLKTYKATWKYSLKWKPVEFNTIDFLITTKKAATGAEFIGNLFQSGINTSISDQITQYKTIILRVGFDEKKHGYINPCQNILNDDLPTTENIDDENTYKPLQFYPTNPYDPEAGITNVTLRLDNTNTKQMFTEENEVIEDNTIIEFRYDINNEKQWRWIPLRIRYDKTAEYRAGYKNYGNAYHVAQSNWNSIHNPITPLMITTGKDIPEELKEDDIYYNKTQGTTHTKALRDFHNLYVKNKLIKSLSNNGDTLIDYAVGKGGDIPKWIYASLSFVFGIDLSRDNIENRLDGACARYLNYKKRFKIMPSALFIQGNTSQNIKNLSAQYTEKGKQITKAIFGQGPNDENIIGKGVSKVYGQGVEGFNISSIQFAIHYMFENIDTLNNFLTNVSECTKIGGYFIGTGFDGKNIFKLLKDKKQNEAVSIFDYDKKNKLLEITKQYDRDEFENNISCLGYAIDVYQESINKTFREYLVNYDYLISILENYGFVQLTVDEAKSIELNNGIGNFSELFNLMNSEIKRNKSKINDYGSAYKMTSSQKSISFLNKYFIFKKVRNVDIQDLKLATNQRSEEQEKKNVVESLVAQQVVKSVIESENKKPIKKSTRKLKVVDE